MDRKLILHVITAASILIVALNVPLIASVFTEGTSPYGVEATAIIFTLLPVAVLALIFMRLKGPKSRLFWVAMGTVFLVMAWELLADPWSIDLRMRIGHPLAAIFTYSLIGIGFLIIAVFLFKKVE